MADHPRIEELRRRVDNDPASIAFAQLAEEYRRAGDYAEAVRVCRAGLARHATYLSARVTLGRALIELEQYEEAQAELEQVLRSAPENLAAIRGLAEIHQRRGDLTEALRQYQAALGIARHDPDIQEHVHALSRQLGSNASSAAGGEPPPVTLELPANPMATFELETFHEVSPQVDSPPSTSPELEAAADEFTKALEALGALTIDLPPALPAASSAERGLQVPQPAEHWAPSDAVSETHVADALMDAPAIQGPAETRDVPAPAPSIDVPLADPVSAEPLAAADQAAVDELEGWLDAIVDDRRERGSAQS